MDNLDRALIQNFPGRVVRKDLTSLLKRGANVPTFVLEYLLGMYCSSDDEDVIAAGIEKIKTILTENYVRPDESEKIKSRIRERGQYTVIDKLTGWLDETVDKYYSRFSNLEFSPLELSSDYVTQYSKILTGGMWCMAKIAYVPQGEDFEGKRKRRESPFKLVGVKPIQMPSLNLDDLISKRKYFNYQEWMDLILRSSGYEPDQLDNKQKFHFIERLVPLVERNYNFCELGPRGTGKSHVYKEISPYSILMSGGQTTTANLFYNLSNHRVGLVGHWDTVAFDEVAGMHFKDKNAIQILKDYMASGSFARGKEEINADASMVYVGNINDSVPNLLKRSNLFEPFPPEFNKDTAFFDRMHYYLPGWEVPKMRSDIITKHYGLITDCLSEFCKEMRKQDFTALLDNYYHLNRDFNKRDEDAVRKTFSGLCKVLFPNGIINKEETKILLDYAIEGRRRVKEQLKLIAGNEFADVNLGYYDDEHKEYVVSVPEQKSGDLITNATLPFGHVFTMGRSQSSGEMCVYRLENKAIRGSGRFEKQGVTTKAVRESIESAWMYFQNNSKKVADWESYSNKDYLLYYADLQNKGLSSQVSVAEFVGLCSAAIRISVTESLVIVGDIKLSGTLDELKDLEEIFRTCANAGATKLLLPRSAVIDMKNIPENIRKSVQPMFYSSPIDAAKIAMNI
ncbi:ATP-dependent Lon protease [Kandleria vitulina]|jgi:ATP-dependent Lon protease|uniref:ATP-dependent Lon protease n=1 Tax=Kandleria vitulina TaxID=1630 RepID=A0A1H2RDP5_9FIRM|nr:protease Lon-related BREX system protein BrxL [Kandleria vitulina]SDW17491.1 ATP-dependent Lon protease [Kandleria vitulina]